MDQQYSHLSVEERASVRPMHWGAGSNGELKRISSAATGSPSTFDFRLSWGLLPKLRPGSVFVDGYPAGHSLAMQEKVIEIRSVPRFASWSKATQGEPGWFGADALRDEQCLVFDVEAGSVVMPCVQAIRAFHAQTRVISHAILRPSIMGELATGELRGDAARLHIAKFVPQGVVTKSFARYLARLVFEQAWRESFSDVFHRRFAWSEQAAVDRHTRIPLQCMPPAAQFMRWTVRGQQISNGAFFVSDLVSTFSSAKPPYRTLTILHHKKGPALKSDASTLAVRVADEQGGKSTRAKNNDPSAMSRPLTGC